MAKSAKAKPAKYSDKSAGQPELTQIFSTLKDLLTSYAKGNYAPKADLPGQYELYYNKEAEVNGKQLPEMPFCSLLIQKGYVGFYFFPIYADPQLKDELDPSLLKLLKGKTCFHIKALDSTLLDQITKALNTGYKAYASKGWK